MSGRVAKYAAVARNEMRTVFAYRGSVGMLLLSPVALITLQYFVWRSVFHDSDERSGVDFSQVLFYAVLSRLWVFIVPGFSIATAFERRVRDGAIVRDLLYPASFVGMWLARAVGRSAGWLLLLVFPLSLAGFVWTKPDVRLPAVAQGVISVVCGYLVAFSLAALVGVSAIFLRRADGLNEMRDGLILVLGAALVPLTFYPAAVADVLIWLPFVYVYYVPLGQLRGE